MLDLKESREGFRQRGKGRLFHVEGPKTEKVREPTEESGRRNNYNRKLWYGTILWCTQTHWALHFQHLNLEAESIRNRAPSVYHVCLSGWRRCLVHLHPDHSISSQAPAPLEFLVAAFHQHSPCLPQYSTAKLHCIETITWISWLFRTNVDYSHRHRPWSSMVDMLIAQT